MSLWGTPRDLVGPAWYRGGGFILRGKRAEGRFPLHPPLGCWVGHNFQDSVLQTVAPIKRSAGYPDPTSLGIFASYILFFVTYHAQRFILRGVFNLAQSQSSFRPLILKYTLDGINHDGSQSPSYL